LLEFLVLVGGLAFALVRRRSLPRPAAWLAAGLTLVLCGRMAGWLGRIFLASVLVQTDFALYSAVLSILTGAISTVGLIFIICSVFMSRSDTEPGNPPCNVEATNDLSDSSNGENPYSPPATASKRQ
jgi:hypothetical protein